MRLPRAQILAERAFQTFERFVHVQAASGIVLLIAAAIALIWANSRFADAYHHLWHMPLSIGIGEHVISHSLHFWINDALMTVFFLVVGMEIRREMHEGALRDARQAALPVIAAFGGVAAPALIYVALNGSAPALDGWAVPTATDIAFAVGVLALLGRGIPANVRVFLLALAIIDDLIAVLIIAFFYTEGLAPLGFGIAAIGIIGVLLMQRAGIGSAWAYLGPGAVLWAGMLLTGAHPTLAGVVLGFMTPVLPRRRREQPLVTLSHTVTELLAHGKAHGGESTALFGPMRAIRTAQRDLLAPIVRVQAALHPWVAFGIMPIFALANAGVTLGDGTSSAVALSVMHGVTWALVIGKPLGIVGASWVCVKLGLCRLPAGVDWGALLVAGLLGGIGFTMSIFIGMLAFDNSAELLNAAKVGVLTGSVASAFMGLAWGLIYSRRRRVRAKA